MDEQTNQMRPAVPKDSVNFRPGEEFVLKGYRFAVVGVKDGLLILKGKGRNLNRKERRRRLQMSQRMARRKGANDAAV